MGRVSEWQRPDEAESRRYRPLVVLAVVVFVAIIVVTTVALLMTILIGTSVG